MCLPCAAVATDGLDQAELRHRLRAARMLFSPTGDELRRRPTPRRGSHRDYLLPEDVAARLQANGHGSRLSASTLSDFESGAKKRLEKRDVEVIADALGLPFAFFVVDLWRLEELSPPAELALAEAAARAVDQQHSSGDRPHKEDEPESSSEEQA